MPGPRPRAAITIDVEDWFHVENLKGVIPRDSWERRELRVERNVHRILQLMADRGVIGTWFVLGWVAERLPALVRTIAGQGHEIASHGYGHDLVSDLSVADFRTDVSRSKMLLEDIQGAEVAGYRAPCFSITDRAIDVLVEFGFRYDCSAFPTLIDGRHGSLADVGSRDSIVEVRPGFHEICVSTLPVGRYGLPWAGGGYFRLLPYRVFRAGVRRILSQDRLFVFYIHPWEFDPDQPRPAGLRRSHSFRHFLNLELVEGRFTRLLGDLEWTAAGVLLDNWKAERSSSATAVRTSQVSCITGGIEDRSFPRDELS